MGLNRLRIVYADDDALLRDTVTHALVEEGIEVHSCADGADVMHLCAEVRPDAVLLDLNMPKVDGMAAARLLRGDARHDAVRLVAMTGQGTLQLRREAIDAGFDAFLDKPANIASLLKALQPA